MPIFSGGKLAAFDTPFVDMRDPTRRIQCLTDESSPTTILTTQQWLREGRLVDADVWLSCTMRRNVLADFMIGLKEAFDRDCERKNMKGVVPVAGPGTDQDESGSSGGGDRSEENTSTLDEVE